MSEWQQDQIVELEATIVDNNETISLMAEASKTMRERIEEGLEKEEKRLRRVVALEKKVRLLDGVIEELGATYTITPEGIKWRRKEKTDG